jgi:hypothetical protein
MTPAAREASIPACTSSGVWRLASVFGCRVCRVTKRSLLHLATAALLLIAQHGAITHSVWHLGNHAPAQALAGLDGGAYAPGQEDHSPQSRLCDLHLAMGSLFAADCGGHSVPETAQLSHWLAPSTVTWRVAQPSLPPPSRAPPVLL